MRRLSEEHGDDEDPREDPRRPTGGLPGQFRQAPWQDESDRALRDSFSRLVQPVPEPPPPERNPVLVGALIGLVVAFAVVSAYAGMTFMTRPAAVVASNTHVEAAADASSSAVPAPASTVAPSVAPSFAPIAPAAAAQAPTAPIVRPEDSPANLAARIANAAPTATRNVQSTVQGVTDTEIRFGIAAPFSGPAKEMGRQLKLGIETAFAAANDSGGVEGRQLKLVTADDGYEPTRTLNAMKQLYEKDQVFGFVDNYGSPTALVSIPYALEHHALYFGAFTGAPSLRHDPPDRYVFNYRAGYAEEADSIVRYLVKVRGLRPDQIGVLTQQDAYGDAGMDGVAKAVRALRGGVNGQIFRMSYNRNTVNVDDAVAQLRKLKVPLRAVVLVATFRPAAKFIEKTRELYPDMIYATISGVGSTGLADELMLLGSKYASGIICTQVTPAVDSYASVALAYKNALAKYSPGEAPDYVSLEAFLTANILIEGLKRTGPQLDTETLVDKLENMRNFEMGLGPRVNFGPSEHQAVHKVWGTQLDETGHYHSIDLE
jgi:ABC-type branched-subunit amino acid transport system substrate-binding protein